MKITADSFLAAFPAMYNNGISYEQWRGDKPVKHTHEILSENITTAQQLTEWYLYGKRELLDDNNEPVFATITKGLLRVNVIGNHVELLQGFANCALIVKYNLSELRDNERCEIGEELIYMVEKIIKIQIDEPIVSKHIKRFIRKYVENGRTDYFYDMT